MVKGTTAPAATRPEALFSMVSRTSRGFLVPGGRMVPRESLAATRPTMRAAGMMKLHCAYHGSAAFCSGVLALRFCQTPRPAVPSRGEMATPVTAASVLA
jgi:hypothetical protein